MGKYSFNTSFNFSVSFTASFTWLRSFSKDLMQSFISFVFQKDKTTSLSINNFFFPLSISHERIKSYFIFPFFRSLIIISFKLIILFFKMINLSLYPDKSKFWWFTNLCIFCNNIKNSIFSPSLNNSSLFMINPFKSSRICSITSLLWLYWLLFNFRIITSSILLFTIFLLWK